MNTNLQALRAIGQSLWLDNITRAMLDDGTLERWIGEYGLTGLTSNPSAATTAPACRARRCSSNLRWKTCAAPRACSNPRTRPAMASTAGCRWSCRR